MNTITDKLTSLNLERQFLGGLFNHHKKVLYDVDLFLKESDFSNVQNQTIYTIIKNIILEGDEPNKVIVAQKVKDLRISFKDEISPFDYIESLTHTQITDKATIGTAKEIVKLRVRRSIYQDAGEVQTFISGGKCSDMTVTDMVNEVDKINNKTISQINEEDEPIDIFENIENIIKTIAANPIDEVGMTTPFPVFNQFFGGLRHGNGLYNIISRSGEGKSCFLFNMAKGVSLLNNVPTLYLDTEMDKEMNMFRAVAAETGINSWFLETGKWIKNAEMAKKVLEAFPKLKKYEGKVYHKMVPNKDIREILAIIRKWYFKYVGRGNKALIIYDYLKITSDIDKNRQEWQQLGDKVSYLNEIGAKLGCPIWSAGQQNRSAENQGQRNDDSTTAGASDRINQYVCFNGTFRAKTLEELEEQGPNFGTHLLKPFKTSRTSGENSYINNRLVRVRDAGTGKYKYKQNFINYNIHEYNITETGTYRDIIEHLRLDAGLQGQAGNEAAPF